MSHLLEGFRFCPKCGSDRFVENSEKSKKCEACGFEYFHNPSAATVAVILNERGEVLITRRAKNPAKGTLDLPGGFCDCFETAEESIVREIKEETGMRVVRTEYLFSVTDEYLYSGHVVHCMDNVYLCEVESTDDLKPMDDVCELMWMAPEDLRVEDFGLDSMHQAIPKVKELLTNLQRKN